VAGRGVPDALRMECTGFGLNLVGGNYEFASLIVIDDEEFWCLEVNWESVGLRLYSSRDCGLLAELIADERWKRRGVVRADHRPNKGSDALRPFQPV
jgi:hypothetical protein